MSSMGVYIIQSSLLRSSHLHMLGLVDATDHVFTLLDMDVERLLPPLKRVRVT